MPRPPTVSRVLRLLATLYRPRARQGYQGHSPWLVSACCVIGSLGGHRNLIPGVLRLARWTSTLLGSLRHFLGMEGVRGSIPLPLTILI